jgi:hypothetical protein
LRDDDKEIRYEKVFEWCLQRFGDDDKSLFEFQAARMRNYMMKRRVEDGLNPRYYTGDRFITGEHVTRFYGACLAKMFMGNQSINRIQAMVPLTAPLFGAIFLRGHISVKNRTYCPLLRKSATPFKSTCLLITLK